LKNPHKYTGQCWRGTAATVLADAGYSKPQIKAVTGHKSDKAVDVYIANSSVQKSAAAHALSIPVHSRFDQDDHTTESSTKKQKLHTTESTTSEVLPESVGGPSLLPRGSASYQITINNYAGNGKQTFC